MRRGLFLLVFLLGVTAVVVLAARIKGPHGIIFVTQDFRRQATDEELARMQSEVAACYPAALDQVCAFIGSEKPRKVFKDIYIALYDIDNSGNTYGYSGYSNRGAKRPEAVTFCVQNFLTGNGNVKTILVHEMLHAAMESQNNFKAYHSWPSYVHEGISYHGSDDAMAAVVSFLNRVKPRFDLVRMWEDRDKRTFLRERTFLFCFEENYGVEARKKLVTDLFSGRNWKKAIVQASGEPTHSAARAKCDACTKAHVQALFDEGRVFRDIKALKSNDEAIAAAEKYLAENPAGNWRISVTFHLAERYEREKRFGEAIAACERIRTGKFGRAVIDDVAAYNVIENYAKKGDCDTALAKRLEFRRLYPILRNEWKDDLNEVFAKRCTPKPADTQTTTAP